MVASSAGRELASRADSGMRGLRCKSPKFERMILLDTNVLSESCPRPGPRWFAGWTSQPGPPSGHLLNHLRNPLWPAVHACGKSGPHLSYCCSSSAWLPERGFRPNGGFSLRRRRGRREPIRQIAQNRPTSGAARDTMIAGIVLASHATLATRNVKHFEHCGVSRQSVG